MVRRTTLYKVTAIMQDNTVKECYAPYGYSMKRIKEYVTVILHGEPKMISREKEKVDVQLSDECYANLANKELGY